MFKNKHIVVAMLVAPVLAIMAWFAVDYFVAERPHAAQEGATYKLLAKSNCRYASGECDLENNEFELSLRPEMLSASSVALALSSSHHLDTAVIGFVDAASDAPAPMTQTDNAGKEWQVLLPRSGTADATIRLAVTAQGATWFAEVPTVWLETGE